MTSLVEKSSHVLSKMYDSKRCLFSYSTTLSQNGYVNNFDHPLSIRYSIISLLGIRQLTKNHSTAWNFSELLNSFLQKNFHNVTNAGDRGLLLFLLADADHPSAREMLITVQRVFDEVTALSSLTIQDLCWCLLGASRYTEQNENEVSARLSRRIFQLIHTQYWNKDTLFPYHDLSSIRRRFVTFGGITYFLFALYEYSRVFRDRYCEQIFRELTQAVAEKQGGMGEWAWFTDARTGLIMDWYQVYSVHQASMSMLFLLPAYDLGAGEAENAIRKSYAWLFGNNQLQTEMIFKDPFYIFRSIKASSTLERERRIVSSTLRGVFRREAELKRPGSLSINKECRSYEIGWLLYAWAGRNDFTDFTGLAL